MKQIDIKSTEITISLPYQTLEDLIASHLYALKIVPESTDIIFIDLPLEVDSDGLVDIDLHLVNEETQGKLI